jgi:hypothetical protein
MKSLHLSVEEIHEYAKYLVLTGNTWQLREEQLFLFAQQHHHQLIIRRSGYDYAISDSPLHLCPFYAEMAPQHAYRSLEALADEAYSRTQNINFFLSRDVLAPEQTFEVRGREHDLRTTLDIELRLREYLARKNIEYVDMPVDMMTPWNILEHIRPVLAPWPTFQVPAGREGGAPQKATD